MTSSGISKKFLEPELIREALQQVGRIAAAEKAHVALAGGCAMQLYGSDRLTTDVDILSDTRLRSSQKWSPDRLLSGKPLSFGGEQTKAPNGVPLDIIRRDDEVQSLYEEALDKSVRIRGVPILVVQPEYLAAMKFEAQRIKDELDLAFLISSKSIDLKKTRKIIYKHLGWYAAREFDRAVDETMWKASRGKI